MWLPLLIGNGQHVLSSRSRDTACMAACCVLPLWHYPALCLRASCSVTASLVAAAVSAVCASVLLPNSLCKDADMGSEQVYDGEQHISRSGAARLARQALVTPLLPPSAAMALQATQPASCSVRVSATHTMMSSCTLDTSHLELMRCAAGCYGGGSGQASNAAMWTATSCPKGLAYGQLLLL